MWTKVKVNKTILEKCCKTVYLQSILYQTDCLTTFVIVSKRLTYMVHSYFKLFIVSPQLTFYHRESLNKPQVWQE